MRIVMKINNIFAIAASLLVMAACTEEENPISTFEGGLDSSKPTVTDVTYDATGSGAKAVTVSWNADKALAAGATSFTFELCLDKEVKDVTNASVYKVINAPETAGTISGLNEGDYYYARVRANYDGLLYSEWAYMPDGICVGKGVVEIVFAAPANLTAKPTDISFEAAWDKVPFAVSYTFGYKEASASEWTDFKDIKATKYEVVGLKDNTTYDIRVNAVNAGGSATEWATATVTTKETSKFNPNITTADQFIEFMTAEAPEASAAAKYTLGADIDLSGKTVPAVAEFKGSIDGQNHVIKNLSTKTPLFTLLKGEVSNIVFDASCKFTPEALVFGTVAERNQGTISGCVNKAAITLQGDAFAESIVYGGIVAISEGAVKDCTNEGAITVKSATSTVAAAVAGIAGYQKAAISGCTNKGAITFETKYISAKSQIEGITSLPTLGGIVGLGNDGFALDKCDNYGKITVAVTAADTDLTASMNRNQHGGIVGSPVGPVSDCHNYGDLDITLQNSAKGTALAKEYIMCVGGIGGGDYINTDKTTRPANTSYTNCVNEGNISLYSDANASNSAVGGIVGWPGQEVAITDIVTKNCTNKGNITIAGALKVRAAGIQGGTGVMDGCVNEGKITIESANAASAVGSLCGFHSQGHAITNCQAKGEVITKVALTGGTGGLIGNIGNVAHTTGEGCSVNCKITTPATDATCTGFVVGLFNGNTKVITLGTADNQIKVAGTLNGEAPNANNVNGTKNYLAGTHTIFASF